MGCRIQGRDVFHLGPVKGKYPDSTSTVECFLLHNGGHVEAFFVFAPPAGDTTAATPSSFHQCVMVIRWNSDLQTFSALSLHIALSVYIVSTLNDVFSNLKCRKS